MAQLGRGGPRRGAAPRATGCSRCATRRCWPTRAAAIPRIYAHHGLEGGVDEALEAAGAKANIGRQDNRVGVGKWREGWGRRELRDFDRVAGDLLRELGYAQG